MKLAQALQERADLNKKISQLEYRLSMNAVVQEGEDSLESPKELLKELNTSYDSLENLISRINLTNCNTRTEYNNSTLTELIAKRDVLTKKINSYRNLASSASDIIPRASRSEIKILSNVDVKNLQKEIDSMSCELRKIEDAIQFTNWTIELM
mgnify:FL=1